jgi:hypothetical protein
MLAAMNLAKATPDELQRLLALHRYESLPQAMGKTKVALSPAHAVPHILTKRSDASIFAVS